MTYFDSCYLAKLYLREPDSPAVRARAAERGDLASCAIAWGEVLATFHRHLRKGRLAARDFRLLALQLEADVRSGLWTVLPVTSGLVEAQARRMARLPDSVFLRAADALHLTCAVEAGAKEIYSNDRRLVAAAPHFGLRAVSL